MNQRPKSSLGDATIYNDGRGRALEDSTISQTTRRAMPDDAVSQLSQYLDKIGQQTSLSWQESTTGSTHEPQWSCVCKIDGVVRGAGLAERKFKAKNIAAAEALRYLTGSEPPDEPQSVTQEEEAGNSETSSTQAQDGPDNATDELMAAPDGIPSENSDELAG